MRGNRDTLKQNSSDTLKVWWMPVLTRGKFHVECFGADFPGETAAGAKAAAERLGPMLNIRFPNQAKPKIVMTDKGKAFYYGFNSKITNEYKAGLTSVGLKAFMGDDASKQPGTMGDLMLHETAVAWLRKKMEHSPPACPWKETREQFKERMKEYCRQINAAFDVEGLCRELPERLEELKRREGDKLKK